MSRLIFCFALIALLFAGCKKEDDPAPPDDNSAQLVFSSLLAAPDTVAISEYSTLTATATGDGLTYKWTPEYGTIIGTGATVQWNVCHSDVFTITCEVKDKYGATQTKSVDIYVLP